MEEEQPFETRWNRLVADVEASRERYAASREAGAAATRAAARAHWASVESMLLAYRGPENWPDDDWPSEAGCSHPRFEFPREAATYLAKHANYLKTGKVSGSIAAVRGRGRTAPTFDELLCMRVAVSYVHSTRTRAGLHTKPLSISEVCDAFGIRRRTLEGWIKEITVFDTDRFGPEELEYRFPGAAEEYRLKGRSAVALGARSSKRAPK